MVDDDKGSRRCCGRAAAPALVRGIGGWSEELTAFRLRRDRDLGDAERAAADAAAAELGG